MMTREEYIKQVVNFTHREILDTNFSLLLNGMAINFFLNLQYSTEFSELEQETRRRLKQLVELGYTDE